MDVTGVEMKGQSLIVHGNRVALVAQGDGTLGLERRVISSTTQIWPSFRRGDKNKFHAEEELTVTIQPGARGNFEPAITEVFAEGLAQLANAVVHVRVGKDGVPVGLQIVRALRAGLDEQALQAASQYRFRPATRDGLAVPVNANIDVRFQLQP